MATFIPVPNVAECVIKAILGGQQINNVLHLKNAAGWTTPTLTLAVNALMDAWKADILPKQSIDLAYQGIHAKDLTTSMGVEVDIPWTGTSTGTIGNPAEPGNVALAVGLKTGLAGRSARGRIFFAGLPENSSTDSLVTEAFRIAWQAAVGNVVGALTAAGFPLGVVSKYSGYTQTPPKYKKVPTPRVEGIYNAVTTAVADRIVDSMRKRLPGRGS